MAGGLLGQLRIGFEDVLPDKALVGQPVFHGVHAGERKARGQRAHVFHRHVAALGDEVDEHLVDLIHLILVPGALLLGERAVAGAGVLGVGRGDVLDGYTQLLVEPRQVGHRHDDADGADGGRLVRENVVGLGRDHVGGTRVDGGARDHHGLGEVADVGAHLLAGRGHASAGVHAQHDRLDMRVLLGGVQLAFKPLGA